MDNAMQSQPLTQIHSNFTNSIKKAPKHHIDLVCHHCVNVVAASMPRWQIQRPPRIRPVGSNRRISTQILSYISVETKNYSSAPPDPDILASIINHFDPMEPVFTDNPNVPAAIEDGLIQDSTRNRQSISVEEIPISLEIELADDVGNTRVEARHVLANRVAQARRIIFGATQAGNVEQNKAIDEAVQFLYPYAPRKGQRNALQHLIYKRKDLILIAKTSFGKSMILQAVSILIYNSITVVVLPLNQIGQEQAEYITRIGGTPCFLNADTISAEILQESVAGYTL
jgi:hypothetical protein